MGSESFDWTRALPGIFLTFFQRAATIKKENASFLRADGCQRGSKGSARHECKENGVCPALCGQRILRGTQLHFAETEALWKHALLLRFSASPQLSTTTQSNVVAHLSAEQTMLISLLDGLSAWRDRQAGARHRDQSDLP